MKKIDNEKIFKLKTECKIVLVVKTGNKYSMAANLTVTLLFIRRTNKFNHPQETVILALLLWFGRLIGWKFYDILRYNKFSKHWKDNRIIPFTKCFMDSFEGVKNTIYIWYLWNILIDQI